MKTLESPVTPPRLPENFWNVPNVLTLSRLVLAVVVFACMAHAWYLAALVVFVVAALTDALDGYFARLLDQGTAIGRQLDPLVDKVIVCGAFIYLLTIPDTGLAPWMVTTIVVRELLIQGLRSHLEGGGQAFGARMAGKLKTLTQCLSIAAILIVLGLQPSPPFRIIRDLLTWSAVGLTIYSGLGYFALAIPKLKGPIPFLAVLTFTLRRDNMDWIESLALGVVQGITEFLPISSDGHLNITQLGFNALTGRSKDVEEEIFFIVMLHVGTLLAIVLHYRQQVIAGAKGLLGDSAEVSAPFQRSAVIRTGVLAFIATLPLIPDKLFFMKYIEEAFKSLTATGVGFLITAAILILTIRLKGGEKGAAETSWLDALLVGIAQMFAPLPGVSRSGLTISAALALGFSKTWAVNFSLMMAVPAILGATVFELRKVDPSTLTGERVSQIVASAAVAGVIGYLAIVWLLRLVRAGRLWYFSVYLIFLGLGLIAVDQMQQRRRPDARPPQALDRPLRDVAPGSGDRAGVERAFEPLAGSFATGPRASRPGLV